MFSNMTGLERWFLVLAWIQIIAGIVLAISFAPQDPGLGYTWKTVAYTMSIVWLAAGIVGGMVFLAIGNALYYLRTSANSMGDLRNKIAELVAAGDAKTRSAGSGNSETKNSVPPQSPTPNSLGSVSMPGSRNKELEALKRMEERKKRSSS